ncbi:hypothetical protein FOC4_g10010622 [Fusarium odoratissimum]|uniref:Uncharacterized protein n=1 Tax=Fusarium oxysporum f. sp. cubense (strain race 4) TaxID=2502994 RepID=N1REL9_FUSC4|nr:hypothetical protein FOC4_g10010622 [Fusarium odoratissimum]
MSGQNNSESDPTLGDALAQDEIIIDAVPAEKKEERKGIPTLDQIAPRCVMSTGLTAQNPRLTAQESFCELLRWWKDRIIESFGLQLTDFNVAMEKRGNPPDAKIPAEFAFTAQDGSGKPLGYIHFMNSRDGKGGTVTVAVRDVTLQPKMVLPDVEPPKEPRDVRFTHRPELGLGRAVLNFLGAGTNHGVTCRTGSYKYKFNFDPDGGLKAFLTAMNQDKINEFRRSTVPQGSRYVPFQPHPKTDTIFTIGADSNALGRGGRGRYIYRSKVTPKEFNTWCEPALFLQEIKDDYIVKTEMGDLILDSKLRGKIYLKGFLLSDTTRRGYASLSERPLRFGYNILYGTPNEKMKHMSSLEEELVLSHQLKAGVSWIAKAFGLAVELPDSYWSILKPYNTFYRKLYNHIPRLLKEEPVSIPDTQFAVFVDKALQSCLFACKHTETLRVMFFDALRFPHWTILVDDDVVRVPNKWLDRRNLGLSFDVLRDASLADLMVAIPSILFHFVLKQVVIGKESFDRQKAIARRRLLDYTREELHSKVLNLNFETGSGANLANVSWEATFSPRSGSNYHVQLHQTETCSDHRNAVLVRDILPTSPTCIKDTCHISEVYITKEFRRYCIKDCLLGQEYFGIVYNPDEPLSIPLVTSTFTVPLDVSTTDDHDVEMALEGLEDLQSQPSF